MDAAVQTGSREGDSGRERIVTGVVDVVLIGGLVLLGRASHEGSPITEPLASLETVTPFVIGWLVVALLAGVYSRDRPARTRGFRLTTVAWIAAANVGLMIRGSPLFEGGTNWPFPVVITVTGLIVLLGWRLGYTLYLSAKK